MNGLNLHAGGELVTFDQLIATPTPEATATHVPIPHSQLVMLVRSTLAMFGHEIVEEHHALDHDGARYFGLMTLKSPYGDYTDTVGLRNSADKSFPIGIAFGSRVFICSNLAFIGDHVIKRKHTSRAKLELPGLLMGIIEPLHLARQAQAQAFDLYRQTPLTITTADHLIVEMFRGGILNIQRVPEVLEAFDKPPHEEWGDHTAWTLFNATTAALNGRVAENPRATAEVHKLLDGVCKELALS